MISNKNSGNTTGNFVVAPEFSLLLSNSEYLYGLTAEAFLFADDKERLRLFKMREFLRDVFPDGIKTPSSATEQIAVLDNLKSYLEKEEHNGYTVLNYGNINLLDKSDEYYRAILKYTDHVTVDSRMFNTDENIRHFLKYISRSTGKSRCKVHITVGRFMSEGTLSAIRDLWISGTDFTLCNRDVITSAFKYSGLTPRGSIDFYDGIPILCGQEIIKPISIGSTPIPEDIHNTYRKIKSAVSNAADTEVSARFTHNKGALRYRSDNEICELDLLYRNCIDLSSKRIKGIISGGAEYDCLFITVNDPGPESMAILAGACKAYDGLYPLKLLPFCRIARKANTEAEIRDVFTEHESITKSSYGASILELTANNDCNINSILSFFTIGGMILDMKHEEAQDVGS